MNRCARALARRWVVLMAIVATTALALAACTDSDFDGDPEDRGAAALAAADVEASTEAQEQAAAQAVTEAQAEYENMEARRKYLVLQRDSDMQMLKEVQLMKVRDDARRVRLAQRALTPREPSFPKPEVIIPLGMFLLVGSTVGLIFLRELTDRRIRGANDLAVIPGGSVIGVIPDLEDDPTGSKAAELVVRRHPQSVLAESYRQAWTAVVKTIDQAGHRTLLVVGCLPGAGTTTVATNLALTAAAAGKSLVSVIDRLIAEPLEINRYAVPHSPDGHPFMGGGIRWLARDFLKFPQLLLNDGVWNDRRILSRSDVQLMLTPAVKMDGGRDYAYLWWIADYPYRGRTVRAHFMGGNGGQIAMLVPELDLSVVFNAGNYSDRVMFQIQEELIPNFILPAITD